MKHPEEINEVQSDFWGNLYSSKQDVINTNILDEFTLDLPQLPDLQRRELDQEISLGECKSALFSMVDGKAPCEDGLTATFYKGFWEMLQGKFLDMINEVYKKGTFPECMNMEY